MVANQLHLGTQSVYHLIMSVQKYGIFMLIIATASASVSWAGTAALAEPAPLAIWNQLTALGANAKKQSADAGKLLGPVVQVAGFITANEFNEGEISEFLLARYPGGCVHVPLPPPSSMIHVTMTQGKTTPIFFGKRVIVVGTLQAGGRVDSTLEMTASAVKEYPW
jgi:hypothetical protein